MGRPNKSRSLAECAKIVSFALTPGERATTAATKFNVHPSTIYYWMHDPRVLDLVDPPSLLANHSLTKNHKPGSGSIPKPEPPIEIPDTIDPRPKVSGTRRSWSKGQKLAVLREADATSVEAVMSRHSLNYEQIKRWRGIVIDGKPDRPHIKRVDSTTTLPKSNGSDTVQQPRGLSHRHEAYIQLRRWYDARLKWIRSGGTPGTHDVYAELALRALEGSNK